MSRLRMRGSTTPFPHTHSLLGASCVVSGSSGTLRSVDWYFRRFGTTYHYHLQRSSSPKKSWGCLTLKNVKKNVSKHRKYLRCVTSQKCGDFVKQLHFNLSNRIQNARFVAIINNKHPHQFLTAIFIFCCLKRKGERAVDELSLKPGIYREADLKCHVIFLLHTFTTRNCISSQFPATKLINPRLVYRNRAFSFLLVSEIWPWCVVDVSW